MNTTLNQNRSFNLLIVAGIVIALAALSAIITSGTGNVTPNVPQNIAENPNDVVLAPLSADAFLQYRQSEWHSMSVPVTNISGSDMYRQSERTLIPAQAGLMAYQLSERTLSPIVNADLSSYHLSERTMTEAAVANTFAEYFASEHTLVDPLAALAIFFESERTSIPVQFTPYQISEWFGK